MFRVAVFGGSGSGVLRSRSTLAIMIHCWRGHTAAPPRDRYANHCRDRQSWPCPSGHAPPRALAPDGFSRAAHRFTCAPAGGCTPFDPLPPRGRGSLGTRGGLPAGHHNVPQRRLPTHGLSSTPYTLHPTPYTLESLARPTRVPNTKHQTPNTKLWRS